MRSSLLRRRLVACAALWAFAIGAAGCMATRPAAKPKPAPARAAPVSAPGPVRFEPGQETALFDGASLGAWRSRNLGAEDDVKVRDGAIHLSWGAPGSGIRWSGPAMPSDYALRLRLTRLEGSAGGSLLVTFPVASETCTLTFGDRITTLCPSERPEGEVEHFLADASAEPVQAARSYDVRIEVSGGHLRVWIDDEPQWDAAIPAELGGRAAAATPLAIDAWATAASVDEIRLRPLPD